MSILADCKGNGILFSDEKKRMFFASDIFKLAVYFIAAAISFCVLNIGVKAGIADYSDIYALDIRPDNSGEIGINDDIRIVFNQPIVFLNRKNININPRVEFDFDLTDNHKSLVLNNSESFLPETKYEIELKNIRGLSGLLAESRKFIFYTKPENVSTAGFEIKESGEKYLWAEFELSKDKYIPPAVSTPKIDTETEPAIKEGKYIDVSISNQVMTLFENGMKVNNFLVSTGMLGMSTPLGMFSVKTKEPNHWSGYGLWMPYSMNFYGPYYIHELPYWPSGYREGENHLGARVSHGCIRLGIGPAEYVYNWADIGTPVYVHN